MYCVLSGFSEFVRARREAPLPGTGLVQGAGAYPVSSMATEAPVPWESSRSEKCRVQPLARPSPLSLLVEVGGRGKVAVVSLPCR